MALARALGLKLPTLLKSCTQLDVLVGKQAAELHTGTRSILALDNPTLKLTDAPGPRPPSIYQQTAGFKIRKRIYRMPTKIQEIVEAKLSSIEKIPDPVIPPPVSKPLTKKSFRCGVIAYKVGMTQDWDEHGVRVPLTVLWIDSCQVVGYKIPERNGYWAMIVAAGSMKAKQMNPGALGLYLKLGIPFKRQMKEYRVSPDALLPIGYELRAHHYVPGQQVDVTGWTQYKGFQGVMKRWGFKGGPATHGCSLSHRTPGSISSKGLGKVWKGKKLPGHMGNERRTYHNVRVFKIDAERNLIYLRGQVPGPRGYHVFLRDGFRTPWDVKARFNLPFPTQLTPLENPVMVMKTAKDPYRPFREDTDYFEQKWKRGD